TDENGWQYAFAFTEDGQWRHTLDAVQTWVRRRQHYGRRVCPSFDCPATAEGFAETLSPTGSPHVESMLSEKDQLHRYIELYLSIRNDVDFTLGLLEKHKNLITWKDATVSTIIALLLAAILVLALLVPTRAVFSLIFALCFYSGSSAGQRKRMHRVKFLDALTEWGSSVCGSQLCLKGDCLCTVLEDRGVPQLALRDWCNSTFKTQLNLRALHVCVTLAELADLVVQASPTFEKTVRRYRAWHSDIYFNFLDHVPSDDTLHEAGCICYKLPEGASLPEVTD
ncbi:unnamed protein product, partial [Polarella glacialis]